MVKTRKVNRGNFKKGFHMEFYDPRHHIREVIV